MKLFLIFLLISCAKANTNIPLPSKATVIAVKSAELIELKFKLADPGKVLFKPFYEAKHRRLAQELSQFITH